MELWNFILNSQKRTVDEVPATAYVDVGADPQFERLARELRPPARKRRRRDHVPDGKSVDD